MTIPSNKAKASKLHRQDKYYIDMQIAHYFHRLEVKIADTKGELLNWFVKMFIGQVTGFISIFIALASIIRG